MSRYQRSVIGSTALALLAAGALATAVAPPGLALLIVATALVVGALGVEVLG